MKSPSSSYLLLDPVIFVSNVLFSTFSYACRSIYFVFSSSYLGGFKRIVPSSVKPSLKTRIRKVSLSPIFFILVLQTDINWLILGDWSIITLKNQYHETKTLKQSSIFLEPILSFNSMDLHLIDVHNWDETLIHLEIRSL